VRFNRHCALLPVEVKGWINADDEAGSQKEISGKAAPEKS